MLNYDKRSVEDNAPAKKSRRLSALGGFFDLERINAVLADSGWNIEEHLGTLLHTISDNFENPALQLRALRQVEDLIGVAIDRNVKMAMRNIVSQQVLDSGDMAHLDIKNVFDAPTDSATLSKFLMGDDFKTPDAGDVPEEVKVLRTYDTSEE